MAWPAGFQATVSANLPPLLTDATVDGAALVLTFAEELDAASKPAPAAFLVKVDGTGAQPASVDAISGSRVTMTLAAAVEGGQAVTVSYTPPGTNPLQDESGLDAPGFTDEAVRLVGANASGEPEIEGVPQAGQELTALKGDIDDPDTEPANFPGAYAFQWIRTAPGGAETVVHDAAGLAGQAYTVQDADAGHTLKVQVSFADADNNPESRTSAPTQTVARAAEDCAADRPHADWCATMTVGVRNLGPPGTLYGYFIQGTRYGALDDTGIEYGGQTRTVEDVSFEDGPINDSYIIDLDAYVPRGTVFDIGGTELTADASSEQATEGRYVSPPVTTSPNWLDGQKVTVSANLAPVVTAATVDGDRLVLTFAENLDTASKPAASAFTISVDGGAGAAPSSVDTISGKQVTMTLATAVTSGQTVTIAYAVPTTNPLQDESGLDAPGFEDREVRLVGANATGRPTITGVPQAGQTLTAEKGDIADPDTEPADFPGAYAFQWLRIAPGGAETVVHDAAGLAGQAYTVQDDDAGKTLKVRVSFDDADSNPETRTSGAFPGTGAVAARQDDCGTGRPDADWCATLTVERVPQGPVVTLYGFRSGTGTTYGGLDDKTIEYAGRTWTVSLLDFEDSAHTDNYRLDLDGGFLPDGSVLDLGGTALAADAGSRQLHTPGEHRWTAAAGPGWHDGQKVTVSLRLGSLPAEGRPAIAGAAWVGETLTAGQGDLDDPDGLPATAFPDGYALQWFRVDADGTSNREAVPGATGRRYTLTEDDEGRKLILRAAFTDARGNPEAAESAPYPAGSATVIAAGDAVLLLDATLTVKGSDRHRGCSSSDDDTCDKYLAPPTFTSTDGGGSPETFAVAGLQLSRIESERRPGVERPVPLATPYWNLHIWFDRKLREYEVRNLVLELDGETFAFHRDPRAQAGGRLLRQWQKVDTRWNRGDTVAVRILDLRATSLGQAVEPLTVELDEAPGHHDGATPFTFRLAFSEDVTITPEDMRDHALTVTGGTVTQAAMAEDGKPDLWEITVQPGGNAEVAVLIPAGRACAEQGALCTADGKTLGGAIPAIAIPYEAPAPEEQPDPNALTAAFEDVPEEHDGANPFVLRLAFSHEPDLSFRTLRDQALSAAGGTVTRAKRAAQGQNRLWDIHVQPDGNEDVTVTLAATAPCGEAGAVCTADGRALTGEPAATVHGPPALAVEDAEAEEEPGARLAFTVTLSRAAASEVTVDYATADGSAHAGTDYTATSGTLRFLPGGARTQTIFVPVLDDDHDENAETMTLTLSNPAGAGAWLRDATATGTIRNSDLMPQAWLARFGRTVAEQILDAVRDRLFSPPAPGLRVTLAGERIGNPGAGTGAGGDRDTEDPGSLSGAGARKKAEEDPGSWSGAGAEEDPGSWSGAGAEARRKLAALSEWLKGETEEEAQDRRPGNRSGYRPVEPRELLTGSSFMLARKQDGPDGGTLALWGRGALTSFSGREQDLSLSGEVTSAMLGADWTSPGSGGASPGLRAGGAGSWTAGLMVSHARGTGTYRGASSPGSGSGAGGRVESTVTGLYPYGRYAATDRVTVWGTAGYGAGELVLKPDAPEGEAGNGNGESRKGETLRTDMDLMMAALGLRGVVVKAPAQGGPELAVETDALAVRTRSEAVPGGLAAATGDATRLRLGLEGTWRGLSLAGGTLEPRLELGVRHDGGDAETGFGLDAGAGLAWSHPENGLQLQLSGRGLLTHESKGFREQGVAASLAWQPDPERGRGPKLTLTQTLGGSASGGAGALLGQRTLEGLAANDDGDPLENRQLELRLGYGFPALGDRFTHAPEIGFAMSNAHREYSLAWRLTRDMRGDAGALELALEASRREAAGPGAGGAEPEHAIGFRITARW